jgi:hypothetical protein
MVQQISNVLKPLRRHCLHALQPVSEDLVDRLLFEAYF